MTNEMTSINSSAVQAMPKMEVSPGFGSAESFALLQRMAILFNRSTIVPETFRGENKIGNCVIALNMANRMGADPLMVMQNMYIVYGNPSWSSKFMIALFNQCGRFTSIKYKATGKKGDDSQGIIAWATEKETGEVIESPEVTISMAKAEGWYNKDGSKWKTMPDQMLRYRAATWLIRTTAPELSMGLLSADEQEDIGPSEEIRIAPEPTEEAVTIDAIAEPEPAKAITSAPQRKNEFKASAPNAKAKPAVAPSAPTDDDAPGFLILEIKVIASGSAGNCYQISDGVTSLLLDAGVRFADVQKALDFNTRAVRGCLVSHIHSDHAKAAKEMASRGIYVYSTRETAIALDCRAKVIKPMRIIGIDTLNVLAFDVVHDEPCVGFQIDSLSTGERLLYITDAGALKYKFKGITHLLLETNHSIDILNQRVKAKLLSRNLAQRIADNHMSIERAEKYLLEGYIDTSKIEKICLIHMSNDNSNAADFVSRVQKLVPQAEVVAW